jgi:TetR/AcrR family transcriptional regulator, cholesterol catabolism regulator
VAEREGGRRRRAATPRKRDDEVLRAAVKVFYERGYSDATIQDVANELGILKGSLYHYIDTKEDLLLRLFDRLHADVDRILHEVQEIDGLDPLQRLEVYVRRQVLYNLDNLQPVAVYYQDVERLGEPQRSAVVERRHEHERYVTALIREAQGAGIMDPSLDAKLVSNCVFATIIWTYRWYRPGGRSRPEEVAEMCSEFVLCGVTGGAAGAPLLSEPVA